MRRLDLGSVNWWDGMLVARSHFVEQERYFEELLRWLLRYGLPLYGLLPARPGDPPSLEIQASLETDSQLRVDLLHCRAFTRAGSLIHVDADSDAQQAHPVVGRLELNPQPPQMLPVYVRAEMAKAPLGIPDASGNAPRQAHAYTVILDKGQVADDGSSLKIAEIRVANFEVAISRDYLPPCAALSAVDSVRRAAGEIQQLAQGMLDEVAAFLRAAPPAADAHPWNVAARGALSMVATGCAVALESVTGWEAVPPVHFVGGLRSMLRVFVQALTAFAPVKEYLDQQFLQTGGLPGPAGGVDFHGSVARYIASPYVHDAMGIQVIEGGRLLGYARGCLRFIGEKLTSGVEAAIEAPRPKVTYRQQDYYLLDVGQIESSFSEESQVLYFRSLGSAVIRSVLFVLRNNAADGVDERDIRLKGGVNDDRPLYCPELQPDFKERPGRIYLLMDVERNKRERVDYITLRSSGVVNLEELLRKQETDVRVYYL